MKYYITTKYEMFINKLTKDEEGLYAENYKMLLGATKMPLNGEVYILFVDQKAQHCECQFFSN